VHVRGDLQLDAAAAAAKSETRQYAKRQATWLRRNMQSWKLLETQQMARIVAGDIALVNR